MDEPGKPRKGAAPMDKFEAMVPLDEALAAVDRALAGRRLPAVVLPVAEAVGRTLQADAVSQLDLPPFDKSAMDGYAVLPGDERDEYRVLGTVAAGDLPRGALQPGTAVKVMTGAAVPDGAGKVIMVEHTQAAGETIRVLKHAARANICPRGEDIRRGQTVLEAGTTLGPVELANLIACGVREVGVARPVRLAIVSTGDEVVRGPDELGPGKIIDTNGPLLRGLAGRFGMTVAAEELLPDDRESTVRGLRAALEAADIVVASGGVSVGDYDFVLESFSQAGLTVHFSRVAVKPGKPTVFATGPEKVVFGLPGNPMSVLLMFHLFVLRAAALLSGGRPGLREARLRLGADFRRRRKDRREYVPGRVGPDGAVEPVECHGSAHLLALVRADGFFVVPAGVLELARGDEVGFVPLHGSWR